jgi:DNA-binding GntR family transcriptional regulator
VAALMSIAQTVGTANVAEWAKLVLSNLQAPVLRVTRLRHDDQARSVALEEVVLPLDRFSGLAPNGGDIPDIVELAQRHGLSLGRVTERISIVRATRDVASHLRIAAGTDVMKLDRVTETADGRPIEWRVTFARATN